MGFDLRKRRTGTRIYKIDYRQRTRDKTWRHGHAYEEQSQSWVGAVVPGRTAVSGQADLVFRLSTGVNARLYAAWGLSDASRKRATQSVQASPSPTWDQRNTHTPPWLPQPKRGDGDTSRGRNQHTTPREGLRVGTPTGRSGVIHGCWRTMLRHHRDVGCVQMGNGSLQTFSLVPIGGHFHPKLGTV